MPSENVGRVKELGKASWALARTLQHEVSGAFDPKDEYAKDVRDGVSNKGRAERLLGARYKLHRAKYDVHRFPT